MEKTLVNLNRIKTEETYSAWQKNALEDDDVARELRTMQSDLEQIADAFYRDLAFGTGGLRGVIGAGTNRMNIYTVAKASQGLADYVKENFETAERKIAVSYDSRIKSRLFAETASGVFAANGIHVFLYPQLMPTPCLSFAVRRLSCAAGIMVTASHNPAKYNGYKVYGADGCQITEKAAAEIQARIEEVDCFDGVKRIAFSEGLAVGTISYIGEETETAFIEQVKAQSILMGLPGTEEKADKDISIVYSPLNGTGLKPVLRILKESGYTNVTVVKEQEQPDGNFPTCPYPNPEIQEAMALGKEYAKKCGADLLLATDPDCDRVGIAVKDGMGGYMLLSGNETGMLLLDYICAQRSSHGTMPEDPVFVKTIVTIDMAERIAQDYGVRCINVLTGFKYIGEQIGYLEQAGRADSYLFGFEESYGYLSGTYVRDKDAVSGSYLICEMAAFYRAKGLTLLERLEELYTRYGYCLNTLHSYTFEGAAGFVRMQQLMEKFRQGVKRFGGEPILNCTDYSQGIDDLPPADVMKFSLGRNGSVVIRPSGTEPKIKTYISVSAQSREEAAMRERAIVKALDEIIQ